ncbi:hypothetical protein F5I97DRAFT_1930135 [Phlebopus sp. FC_14]|nr:hypothetical protein F5I97DRAFT_1930135 [Phlebopus sp. FC_14]
MATRIAPQVQSEIHLTDAENKLCVLLDEFTRYLKDEQGITTACRINGGWVRDKLLGKESNDVDICLADMMGVPFVERFVAFLSKRKHVPVGKVTKIESNPDQSKHLETARTTLFGIDLDFVNLRDEEYAESSRIPTGVKFGTPLEDALRRDITINSLFYNVHTRSVEDYTGKGLNDLRDGLIRTPLPPLRTFLDDPLRVIRCVRFASRFGFEMTPELKDAARDATIQEALSAKISRERIGEEVDKMMKGPAPVRAIQLINELSLYHSIYYVHPDLSGVTSACIAAPNTSVTACAVLCKLLGASPSDIEPSLPRLHPMLVSQVLHDPGMKARLFLAASLFPFDGITYRDPKRREHLLVEAVIREGLKFGNKNYYLDGISALYSAASHLRGLSLEEKRFKTPSERVSIGLLLRHHKVHKPTSGSHWSTSLLFSLVCELVPLEGDTAANCIHRYNAFVSRVEELGVDKAVDARPLLNGNEVIKVVGSKPGPWTAVLLAKIVEWQLEHPDGSKDECKNWLERECSSGAINIQDLLELTPGSKRVQGDDKETFLKKARRSPQ